MHHVKGRLPGMLFIIGVSVIAGFSSNAMRPDALPLIRKPLRETRAFVSSNQLLPKKTISATKSQDEVVSITTSSASSEQSKPAATVIQPNPADADKAPESKSMQSPDGSEASSTTRIEPIPSANVKSPIQKSDARNRSVSAKKVQALFTNLADAKLLFESGSAVFVDSRPIEDYEAEHIKGSLSLYCEKLDDLYESVMGDLPKNKVIVTYCSDPECQEAIKLADGLVAHGHTKVVILLEGLPGWKDAGYPCVSGKGLE